MTRKHSLQEIANAFINLFFPRKCCVCGNRLMENEAHLCMNCLGNIPHTHYHKQPEDNPLAQRFYGSVKIEKATGYFFYSPQSPYHQILHQIKYHRHIELGIYMGRCMATHLRESGFLNDIDVIVPVPLSAKRQNERGYNQCELLTEGLGSSAGIKVVADAMLRTVDNPTQTHLTNQERWENVKDIFEFNPIYHEAFIGKHILLIDDVTTTGATLTACASTLCNAVKECRISIAALGVAT